MIPHHIPTLGIVRGAFTLAGIQYPHNWLALATEAERAAIGAVPQPTAGPDQVVEHDLATGWSVRDLTAAELADRQAAAAADAIARAWAQADAIALAAADHNSRARYNAWLADPECPAWRRERILAVIEWMDGIWMAYAQVRGAIEAGDLAAGLPADLPPCPYGFWQIAAQD